MPENILVVEYEPRYTDRVRQALAGQPFTASFARDGDEALRSLDESAPQLIVLSSAIPKVTTQDLIKAIRDRSPLDAVPILLTVPGYSGKSPQQDAVRLGVSDILPKPYSESEFLGKVHQMLSIGHHAATVPTDSQLTSFEIFGDLLDGTAPMGVKKGMKPTDDVDKMLADTLAGVRPQRKKDPANDTTLAGATAPGSAPAALPTAAGTAMPKMPTSPGADVKPRGHGAADLDKIVQDTLSGLEKRSRPAPAPAAVQPPAASPFITAKAPAISIPDTMPISQPVLPATPEPREEEEPKDGVRFGQYVLLEKIATGGMAEVWKARMRGVEGFQKIVAIKKILPHLSDNQDFIEMFVDEAKLAAQLNHNNIIHIYDLGKIQSSYYIAMEYVDGHDLKTILRHAQERDHGLTLELALFIASKIAAALDYAHRKRDFDDKEMGLVHRDVSPQNVLISEEGDIKLCDFGIAKAASKASHTQAGALKGKLQYMSPEQAWGKAIDKRSDIFALATVLYEMLTSRKLFTGDNEISILEQVREAHVAPPSLINDEVSPEVDAIVIKALQKDPADRYQTAGEMARDIDSVLYSFRPTPTSADLAIFMHRLLSAERSPFPEHEPVVEAKPVAIAPPPPPPPALSPRATSPGTTRTAPVAPPLAIPPQKKLPIVPIAIAAVVVLGIGGFLMFRGKAGSADATTPAVKPASASAPAETGTLVTDSAGTLAPVTAVPTSAPVLDPALVNLEVQRRLAAERARLAASGQRPAAPGTPGTPPVAAAPVPVTQTTAPPAAQPPAEVASAPPPAAAPTETKPAPVPQPAEAAGAARAKEGDLVGSPDTEPRMTRRATVAYPPIARIQRVEGSVVLRVLVGENGQVMETKMLSGVSRPVGINEAAEQTIRRSSFAPGMKDGVRVKSWTTVRLDFKL